MIMIWIKIGIQQLMMMMMMNREKIMKLSVTEEKTEEKEFKTKDQGTSTPCADPKFFKRRRGRPRKNEVDDIIYYPPKRKTTSGDGMEVDCYPDGGGIPGEEVPKKKSNRGRKKKNRAPLDPDRYRITSDDLQEAFRNGEEKGEFICRECGENYTWKRSYMRHLEAHVQVNEGKDTIYDCKVCNKKFVSEWEMKNHLRGKHKMLFVFDCDTCPRKFHTAIQFKNHKVNCTKENPNTDPIEDDPLQKFTCNYCLMKFKSQHQLDTHKELHNIVEYRCEECGKVFPEAYRLKNHVRDTHDKSDTYVCDVCEKHFTSARYLHRHRTCVHHKTESICRTCGKLFPTKSDLRLHIKIEHEELDATTCPICKIKFPSERALDFHRPEHYNFQCETCGKKFQKLVKLRDHVRSHTNDYAFWCKDCNKGFSNQTNLDNHISNIHSNKVYICSTCGSIFKNHYTLKNHMKVHTDSAEFACKFCDSTYRTGEGLKNHMIENHMTEEQIRSCNMQVYKCEYCEKVFGRRQHYERHRDQHLGVKKYKCPECALGFFSQYHLNRHMKSHLSYPPQQKRIRRPNFKASSTIASSEHEEETEEIPEGTEIIIDNTMIAQEQDTDGVTETVYVTALTEGQEDGTQSIQYAMPQGSDQQMLEFVVINYPSENSNEVGITTTEVGMPSTEEENDVVQSILNLQDGIIADTSTAVIAQPPEPAQ
ncbi:hypothetical protein FSP39_011196 [Pinctada imbricata]|uniref:Uncharacterized protein n=1 Tax=Pinctada imbricata TaxID=66713 RepID=A0AA88Y264_PINIB|nr:hypothetical protein FSP39_011196 [Pinctada imbricata]